MVYMTKLAGQANNGDGEEEVLAMETIQLFDVEFH
jgi:hypothetical protein